jgi:hypothetical protein
MRILPESLLPRLMTGWFSLDAICRIDICAVNTKNGVSVCALTVNCVLWDIPSWKLQVARAVRNSNKDGKAKACIRWLRYVQSGEALGGKRSPLLWPSGKRKLWVSVTLYQVFMAGTLRFKPAVYQPLEKKKPCEIKYVPLHSVRVGYVSIFIVFGTRDSIVRYGLRIPVG